MKFPDSVNIFSHVYEITYCDKLSDVDHEGREVFLGQVDHLKSSIRIYDGEHSTGISVLTTLIHEVIHAVIELASLDEQDEKQMLEGFVKRLSVGLVDVFIRNNFIELEK